MQPAMNDDTDRHQAIRLQHLSPSMVREIDALLGIAKQKNNGYAELTVRFERGVARRLGWLLTLLPEAWSKREP